MNSKLSVNSKSGIDQNRIINKEKFRGEVLLCKICTKLLVEPHDCTICGNTFCYDCINELRKCPFGCDRYNVKPTSYGITSILNQLKFSCINSECREQLSYANVLVHDKECKLSNIICPNNRCGKEVKKHLFEYHIKNECEYSLFKCENCDFNFPRGEFLDHTKTCKVVTDCLFKKSADAKDIFEVDMKDISLSSFLKVITYQVGKITKDNESKFELLLDEIKGLREDIGKINSSGSTKMSSLKGSMIELGHKSLDSYNTNTTVTSTSKDPVKRVLTKNDTVKKIKITNDKLRTTSKSPPRQQSPNTRQCGHVHKENVRCTIPIQQKHEPEKTTLQTNQELIIELLSNISSKLDNNQQLFDKTQTNFDSLKELIKNNTEDIKNNTMEVSIDNSMRTINKLQELLK